MNRAIAYTLSGLVGFLSLSQEVAWVRLLSFAHSVRPSAFAMVLFGFLAGIAIGAHLGRRICRGTTSLVSSGGKILLLAAAADFAVIPLLPFVLRPSMIPIVIVIIAMTAALKGMILPIAHQLGTPPERSTVGRSISRVYLANILGSTLGPILTGFYLLDRLSTQWVLYAIGAMAGLLGAAVLLLATRGRRRLAPVFVVVLIGIGVAGASGDPLAAIAARPEPDAPLKQLVQNRHGVIHVTDGRSAGDVTYGGNIYDGRMNVDMRINSNGLERAYLLAALHPQPRRALIVGLSSGAWTAVIAGFPSIEAIDVVEINPGYLDVIRSNPEVRELLADSKVRIHIDDGRRWIKRNADLRYDLIVQNTTYHWRANASNLLSIEYFRTVARLLEPSGILSVNTTFSLDVDRTLLEVFAHVARFGNFAYTSDAPLRIDPSRAVQQLLACTVFGRPAFEVAQFSPGQIGHLIAHAAPSEARAFIREHEGDVPPMVITDRFPVTEYRHGWRPRLFPHWMHPRAPQWTRSAD